LFRGFNAFGGQMFRSNLAAHPLDFEAVAAI
jgi:hypothetical protein